jgi:hypothetical protein
MYGALKTCSIWDLAWMPMYFWPSAAACCWMSACFCQDRQNALRRLMRQMRRRLRWLTSCSDKGTFFSGMRCIPAVAQPTEAARTIAVFMLAGDQGGLMGREEMQAMEDR